MSNTRVSFALSCLKHVAIVNDMLKLFPSTLHIDLSLSMYNNFITELHNH